MRNPAQINIATLWEQKRDNEVNPEESDTGKAAQSWAECKGIAFHWIEKKNDNLLLHINLQYGQNLPLYLVPVLLSPDTVQLMSLL